MPAPNSKSWIQCLIALVVVACLGVLPTVDPAKAEIPGMINYQGLIVDRDTGDPLPGEHTMRFRIYDAASDGSMLWSEEQQVTADAMGVVTVMLGSENTIEISFDAACWLEVEVDDEVLLPRRQMVSVPYAFRSMASSNADSLGGVYHGDYVVQGDIGVITSDMIADGPGSGLDADMFDGLDGDAFADSGHSHDDRYYTEAELSTVGSMNNAGNPVDWTKLKNVPGGLADGTDDTGPGDGHSLDAADGNPVDVVYVNATGDVGIGTTTPETKLHVRGATPTVLIDATSGDSEVWFKSSGDGNAQIWSIYKDSGTDDLRFYQNGNKVTIDNLTGNVGIGTTAPTAGKLQVENSGTAVHAHSADGTGVFAVAGSAVGGEADAAIVATSTTVTAIRGYSSNGAGVQGRASRATVPAVEGYHSGDGPAIHGSCSGAYPCVQGGRDDNGIALAGYTNDGIAVYAHTSSNNGMPVVGIQTGYTTGDILGWYQPGGYFGGKNGVIGLTEEHDGFGVFGMAKDTSAWAGYFTSSGHGVSISTPAGKTGLTVLGGLKSALVATTAGARSLYCEEASEVWFADYGFGRLVDGVTVIEIDPVFVQTVNLAEPYHVFLQAYGDADLYVASRTGESFEVRSREGDPAVEFSYRLVAKRLGYEEERLVRAPWADSDANLYPGKTARRQGEE
jgi:hypothetical protein